MTKPRTLQIANLIGLLLVLVLNTLAVTLPVGGRTTGEISDLYPNLFVPAGYAFSIWSLIYILLILFIIRQSKGLFSSTSMPAAYVSAIGWWFFISCLANASWILAWHYLQLPLALVLMLLILFSLIQIYRRLDIHYPRPSLPLLIRLPFSVYLGWISVATIANTTALLVNSGWNGGAIGPVIWTVIMLAVATVLGLLFLWKRRDIAYAAVLVWAFIAILVNRQSVGNSEEALIITTIYVLVGVLVVVGVLRMLIKDK